MIKTISILMISFLLISCKSLPASSFSNAITPDQGLKQECKFGDGYINLLYMDTFFSVTLGPKGEEARNNYLIKSDGKLVIPNNETPIRYYSAQVHNAEIERIRQQYDFWVGKKSRNAALSKWFQDKFILDETNSSKNLVEAFLNIEVDVNLSNRFVVGSKLMIGSGNEIHAIGIPKNGELIFKSPITFRVNVSYLKDGKSFRIEDETEWYGDNTFPKSFTFYLNDNVAIIECTSPEKAGWNDAPKITGSNLIEGSAISKKMTSKILDLHDLRMASMYFLESKEDKSLNERFENALRIYCFDFIQMTSTNIIQAESKIIEMLSGYLSLRSNLKILPMIALSNGNNLESRTARSNFEKHIWNACTSDNYPQFRK